MATPTYKVEDGSIITFKVVGPQYNAVLTSPSGAVIEGDKSSSTDYPALAENIILLYNNGTPLKFEEIPSLPSIDSSNTSALINQNTQYELARVILYPPPDVIESSTSQINQDLTSKSNDQLESFLNSQLPFEVKLTNVISSKKTSIQQKLIPEVLSIIAPFSPSIVKALAANFPYSKIEQLIINNTKCPSKDTLTTLMSRRNRLVTQLNGLYSTVTSLNQTLKYANIAITSIQVGIDLIQKIPYPAIGVPPLGLPPLTTGTIETIGASADKLTEALKKARITVNIITLTSASFGALLGLVLKMLGILDKLFEKCVKDTNTPYEQVNSDLQSFTTLTGTETTQNNMTQNNTYKDFKIEVKTDPTVSSTYPRRYAQALNKQGVPVLKTELSFASDSQVLINELKFIIDSNPNITAE